MRRRLRWARGNSEAVIKTDALRAPSVRMAREVSRPTPDPLFSRVIRDDDGQDLIEYALLAGFISVSSIAMIMNIRDVPSDGQQRFTPGQLVLHRRYGYRGVVVDLDMQCKADGQWYQANKTQPDRNQPWYHVLVHDSAMSTYAAQTSLAEDTGGQPVNHPLVPVFFKSFHDGRYVRNETPWGS